MFENLKITAKMSTPTCYSDFLRFDCILSAAKAKEILQSDYYLQPKQTTDVSVVIDTLSEFLEFNSELGVFHASCGVGDGEKEFVTSYSKRWSGNHDEIVKFVGKGRKEIDTLRGFFKSYHTALIYKPLKTITFYARGDKEKILSLLKNISYIGKKGSQGFGTVSEWKVEIIETDKSIFSDGKLMRFVPADKIDIENADEEMTAVIPPAWRQEQMLCYMPQC